MPSSRFVYLDKDGDGEVTLTELREAMQELKTKPRLSFRIFGVGIFHLGWIFWVGFHLVAMWLLKKVVPTWHLGKF